VTGEPAGEASLDDLLDAVRRGDAPAVEAMLSSSSGASIQIDAPVDERKGTTLLMVAAAEGHVNVIDVLLEVGRAEIDARDRKDQSTALLYGVRGHQTEAVHYLLKCGADLSHKTTHHSTALTLACEVKSTPHC
jgi:hypothetical protein